MARKLLKAEVEGKTQIAYVRWFDSSITQGSVCTADDAAGLMENESVGIVVQESDETITIALDRCPSTGGLRCTLCIPWINVRKVTRFTVASVVKIRKITAGLKKKPA